MLSISSSKIIKVMEFIIFNLYVQKNSSEKNAFSLLYNTIVLTF